MGLMMVTCGLDFEQRNLACGDLKLGITGRAVSPGNCVEVRMCLAPVGKHREPIFLEAKSG